MNYVTPLLRIWLACLLISLGVSAISQNPNPGHSIGTITGKYNFSYNETPDQLVEIQPAAIPNTGLLYQWEQSSLPTSGFTPISGATLTSYTFTAPLTQTTYYRRTTTTSRGFITIYSNIIKISVVSVNWEDINYIREHKVLTTGITTWQAVDQLPIGSKLQTTGYIDGIGRTIEQVSRETAIPASGTLWGDVVQFSKYDAYGRQPVNYLPYTTTTQSGKYKTTVLTDQPAYYNSVYNETAAYSSVMFDNSPLNRAMNIKQPGSAWAAGAGTSIAYDVNTLVDDIKIFSVDYVLGNIPVYLSAYLPNSLYKQTMTDENGKKLIQFVNKAGQLICKKIQLDDSPADAYTGWICTYFVYDDFGLLRFQIEPEAVKYLAGNSWSFAGANGQLILNEQCFQYNYDEKGRPIWKKSPGTAPLNMIFDNRNRLVFTQDGNQAALSIPQWTTNIYDELDRVVTSTLYNTSKTIATLKGDINNAASSGSVTITNSSNNGGSSISIATSYNPVSSADLNNSSVTTVLRYVFYDNYSYSGAKTFNTSYTNLSAYNNSDPNVIPIASSSRTINKTTGLKTRVLGSNTFLTSTSYFDERGQLIQTSGDNIKSGLDIITLQHHFDGRTLSNCTDHTTPGTGYTSFKILTKNIFDKLARVTSIQKQFGSNAFKTISSVEYDDIGRIKTRYLDPGYTAGGNTGLESLNYTFNIHNQVTGVNKDYALKAAGYNRWSHFFGLYLGYDNKDNVFSNANLIGQIAGQLWNTQGDDAQRKYNYTYDNAGRLTTAAFTEQQHPVDGWSNSQMDFSVSGSSGKITYDLNGNMLNMLQKGVIPGTTSPVTVDDLNYVYASYSNKLQSVTDQMTNTTVNGLSEDFKDGANGASPDYVYDADGNIVVDLNKNSQSLNGGAPGTNGISYNFMDKPELIRITGKGTIKIIYDASGNKLQRAFIPEAVGPSTIISYINEYEYQETATITTSTVAPLGGVATMSFIKFEDGRVRVVDPATPAGNGLDVLTVDGNMDLPNNKKGAYDFYIMDFQKNVRMILTEETHIAGNTCTMETNRSSLEELVFGQTGAANEVAATRYATSSTSWVNANIGSQVSRLGTNSGHNIGPNTLQKVMAGDKINATVQYYFQSTPGGNNTNFVSTVTSSILQAISGSAGATNLVKNNGSAIATQLGSSTGFINAVQPSGSNPVGSTPQAYLTILFFDERFNFISAADGGVVQQQVASSVGSGGSPLTTPNDYKAPKNGYAFIYVSNQSNNDVYFDNFNVTITAGNIIEEDHYYAYGLKIATISSRKLGDTYEGILKNNYLNQGGFNEMNDDIGWNDFMLRNYDPQIGRWVQIDPYSQFSSGYIGMGSDPINNIDPTGGSSWPPPGLSQFSVVTSTASSVEHVLSITAQTLTTLSLVGKSFTIMSAVGNVITNNTRTAGAGDPDPISDLQKYIRSLNFATAYQSGGANYAYETWGSISGSSLVKHITYTQPLANDPVISVNSTHSANGLQIIQIISASALPGSGLQQLSLHSRSTIGPPITRTAFVDGGIKSPGGKESVTGKPYYNTDFDLFSRGYANASWDAKTNSGSIRAYDAPGAANSHTDITFETYIVLTNYDNSSKDLIVGKIVWGYINDPVKGLIPQGTPKFIPVNEFSKEAMEILHNDYPGYEPYNVEPKPPFKN